ncbi:MAG: CoA transferase [Burkholderiales bacterium]|nr:CoA transferase [Burkholderiales bacterium]
MLPTSTTAAAPLAGIRVLDLTAIVLGPLATQWLGDYGAEVIKVEPPEGDLIRANGTSRHRGMSSIFLALNRNKRSLAIDLKSAAGRAALLQVAEGVDVVVHNMRVAAIERLGLGYAAVAAVNPRVVYCVATGFGQDGPDAARPAFDDVIQAACGLAALPTYKGGVPDFIPSLIADKTVGLVVVNAVLAALLHRERGGAGQYVEVPMLETMATFTLAEHLGGLSFDPPAGSAGYARLLAGGRQLTPTSDGHVALLPYTAAHWQALFKRLGRADIANKYNLEDRHERNARIVELYADLQAVARSLSKAEILAICDELDIPVTKAYRLDELPTHPHLAAVGLFQTQEHPSEGRIVAMRSPVRFSGTPAVLARHAPRLGEHSVEVLREAGIDAEWIESLRQAGTVVQA